MNGILTAARPARGRQRGGAAAGPASQRTPLRIDLPTERVPDWQARGDGQVGRAAGKNKALRVFMDICVRCGACADKCQFYLGTGDPQNMPGGPGRADAAGLPALLHAGRALAARARAARPTSTRRCWSTGTPTSTSAPSAGAAPSSVPTASTRPRSPWPPARSCAAIGVSHQVRDRGGGQGLRARQQPGHPAGGLEGQLRVPGRGRAGADAACRSASRWMTRAQTSCWCPHPPTTSPTPIR